MSNGNYEWIPFYEEFADSLLKYKNNRKELIDKIYKCYDENNIQIATLEGDGAGKSIFPFDIDPFTVFALFNKKISDDNRIKLVNIFKQEFSLSSNAPEHFDGIPLVNNLSATFYYFSDSRGDKDIDNLWGVFEAALEISKKPNEIAINKFMSYYDNVLKQKGIKWNITMGLFWIRPNKFINLDATNRSFLEEESHLSDTVANKIKNLKNPPKAIEYLQLCEDVKSVLSSYSFNYKTFSELSHEAYTQKDVNDSDLPVDGLGDEDVKTTKYWIYSPGERANMWDEFYEKGIMAIGWEIGDLTKFKSKEEISKALQDYYNDNKPHKNDVHCLWQFAHDIQVGDIIFVKRGRDYIIGRGIVTSNYKFDDGQDYPHLRTVQWIDNGIWSMKKNWDERTKSLPLKTLTEFTMYTHILNQIKNLFEEEDVEPLFEEYPSYSMEDFLNEVYIGEGDYFTLLNLLKNKKNLIIQGAPGVGKTFLAKRLAYSIMGLKDVDRCMMIQFHQSYSYEDFIMGFRPSKEGFELKHGSFYNFCKKAEEDDENDYFFIIDEINRGNISKIFGELFMLIENDKRGDKNKIRLVYSDELFFIPKNVYIIGLMNTADRSLAMIDYALRRRFAFFDLKPGFSSEGFIQYQKEINSSEFDNLIENIKTLNEEIKKDESLGEGFAIGHSYFANLNSEDIDEKLNYIVNHEIIPLLNEYWFDEPEKVEQWSNQLRSVIN